MRKATFVFENAVAVVTGGSGGIGRHVARGLAERNTRVAFCGFEATVGDIRDEGQVGNFSNRIIAR